MMNTKKILSVFAVISLFAAGTNAMSLNISGHDSAVSQERIVKLPALGREGKGILPLSSLDVSQTSSSKGQNVKDRSFEGNALTMAGYTYASGVGTHAKSQIYVKLNASITNFCSYIGIDDEVDAKCVGEKKRNAGTARYRVFLIDKQGKEFLQQEAVVYHDKDPEYVDVACQGWEYLLLEVEGDRGGADLDHVDWANAYFEYDKDNFKEPSIISAEKIQSKLDCSKVVYSQPNVRFMHKLRARNAAAKLSVANLPAGLRWNAERQLVEGRIAEEGEYHYDAVVDLEGETYVEPIQLTVSASLQQPVPFMGWLSWNVVEGEISEEVVRTVADAMIENKLDEAGYTYLCIDDIWHAEERDEATGKPLPDAKKFPNGIRPAVDYTHSKGLKFGIYSDAAEYTCAGMFGSYGYEIIDANQYADWGVDLLKYDYCGAPNDARNAEKRYTKMGRALQNSGRDILFYMCEWGSCKPWLWAANTGATCWRCTYDTRDGWNSKSTVGIIQSIDGMKNLWSYSGPNRFNDADMMCIAIHGTGKSSNAGFEKPGMTQDEYRTQFALWCMWSSPLTLSFDLRKPISKDDYKIMTNEEIIAIDQDPMGQQAVLIAEDDQFAVFAKDLENGDVALSVTNLGNSAADYRFDFKNIAALDADEKYTVRDLWLHENVAVCQSSYQTKVASHATKIFRLSKAGKLNDDVLNSMRVNKENNQVVLLMPDTKGMVKNVRITDLAGRIQRAATEKSTKISLSAEGLKGTYFVHAVCNAQAKKFRIEL